MINILIAEDYNVVRKGIIFLIKELYPDAIITEVETFNTMLTELDNQRFDLLLLDVHMPGSDSLQVVETVRIRQPHISILIFSSYDEQIYALRYLHAGANGYLQKRASGEEIKLAIQKVLGNEKYISHQVKDQLVNQLLYPGTNQEALNLLSNREMEVMRLLIKGATPTEIKSSLNIQDSTISTYKSRIFEKMNVSNIIELAEKIKLLDRVNHN